jgi:serine/threonine protein kinase
LKSIYDTEEIDERYVVSPQNSLDDEDDFEDESSAEEEYYSEPEVDESETDGSLERLESSSWDEHEISASISESVSQTLSHTLSLPCVDSGDRSLLRKAISDGTSGGTLITKKPELFEEKKEDMPSISLIPDDEIQLSEVATRLWTFLVAYNNPKDPNDNYLQQVESILEDVEFDIAEQLIDLAVPKYAVEYMASGVNPLGLTMRDIASPKVKALFESYYYFLGRFEFSNDVDGVLLHRSADNNTVWIRATEHQHQTTEYEPPKLLEPGTAEEAIWKTGEVIHDEEGYLASRFKDNKRQVYFKLTRSPGVFENEVKCRMEIGMKEGENSLGHFLPLLSTFKSSGEDKMDRRYKMDVNDERFRILHLYGGESICLADYPFAMVYPHCDEGDLFDYFYHHGVSGNETSEIGLQIVKAVKMMHEKGVVHRNLSMRCVSQLPLVDNDDPNPQRKWVVSDLSGACRSHQSSFLGAISSDGSGNFETGLMPPEMFTKLTSSEEEIYREYWRKVEELYGIKVDEDLVEPYIDDVTGSSFVLRAHYVPDGREKIAIGELPGLPYMLVPARQGVDVWCLGLILFTLCSGGRSLCPTNLRSGHVMNHHTLVHWDRDLARTNIYQYVKDPVAQDIILQLLSSYEDRNNINIESIISHPFFSRKNSSQSIVKIIEIRQNESYAFMRNRTKVVHQKSEVDWLQSRTTNVHCWNFDMITKFHFSASEIVRQLTGRENFMPANFVLLPYKLSAKNKKAKLAPTTKKDVERAERMGVILLTLAKTCYFSALVKQTIDKSTSQKKWDAVSILEALSLNSGDFEDLKEEFIKVAADRIEAFRSDPTTAAHKLMERRVSEVKSFFKDAGTSFLYLVDEYNGIPLVGPEFEPYPLEISESALPKVLTKVLPFMHCSSLVARRLNGGVSGIVRLIFEAAYPHVPPSWASAASGLEHTISEDLIIEEVTILQQTLSSSKSRRSLGDDLDFLRDSCVKVDVRADFAKMRRVMCGGSSLWTSPKGVDVIQDLCNKYDFKQALEIQGALEAKLKSQEQALKQLQDKVEWLSFRKELNLKLPGESSLSTHSASATQRMENTAHNSVSISTHSGNRPEGVAPSISLTSSDTTPKAGRAPIQRNPMTLNSPQRKTKTEDVVISSEAGNDPSLPQDLDEEESSVATSTTRSTFKDHMSLD